VKCTTKPQRGTGKGRRERVKGKREVERKENAKEGRR